MVWYVQVAPELMDWVQVRDPAGSLKDTQSCHSCVVFRVVILLGDEPSAQSSLLKWGRAAVMVNPLTGRRLVCFLDLCGVTTHSEVDLTSWFGFYPDVHQQGD